jgi:hypothetical protein
MTDELTQEAWCKRFVTRMVDRAGDYFDDGESILDYARETAPTYWEEESQRADGPEACADADMSYWGED